MTSKTYDYELRGNNENEMCDLVACDNLTGEEVVILKTNNSFFADIVVAALLDSSIELEISGFKK